MKKTAQITVTGILLAILAIWLGPDALRGNRVSDPDSGASTGAFANDTGTLERATPNASAKSQVDTRVGFTSKRALEEHFQKHGDEFGSITQAQYLRLAQELRDADVGGSVRETVRSDGVVTRFDTRTGDFIAFHEDKSIRTFFKPNDGLRYFERQLDKEH